MPEEWVDEYGRTWLATGWFSSEVVVARPRHEDVFWDVPNRAVAAGRAGGIFKAASHGCAAFCGAESRGVSLVVPFSDVIVFFALLHLAPGHCFLELFALVSCDSKRRLLEEFLEDFLREG